jgi:hypothetical protein
MVEKSPQHEAAWCGGLAHERPQQPAIMKQGQTLAGAGGVFLFDLFSIISFNLLHVFNRHLY